MKVTVYVFYHKKCYKSHPTAKTIKTQKVNKGEKSLEKRILISEELYKKWKAKQKLKKRIMIPEELYNQIADIATNYKETVGEMAEHLLNAQVIKALHETVFSIEKEMLAKEVRGLLSVIEASQPQ